MTHRRSFVAIIALLALGGCGEEGRRRYPANEGPSPPIAAPDLHDSRPDAAVLEPDGPGELDASAPAPPSPDDAGGPSDEVDNTLYWDAASTPTSDNVRGVDAGEPDR